MNPFVISYFDKFSCLGSDCPRPCCRGWDMPVDEETLEKFRKGTLPERLCTRTNAEDDRVMRTFLGHCVYFTKEGLCGLQQKKGAEAQPLICRLYPRHTLSYGDYREGTLDFSCIRAAQLFMKYRGRPVFIETEELPIYWTIDTVVPEFVSFLRRDRERIFDFLYPASHDSCADTSALDTAGSTADISSDSSVFGGASSTAVTSSDASMSGDTIPTEASGFVSAPYTFADLWKQQWEIFSYIYAQHMQIVRNRLTEAEGVSLPLSAAACEAIKLPNSNGELPIFSLVFLNDLICKEISPMYLRIYHPYMEKILKKYHHHFGKLTEEEAPAVFARRLNEMALAYPEVPALMKDYYAYLLGQTLLQSSIDFYLPEPVLLSQIFMEFYMLFALVLFLEGEPIDEFRLARLLCETEGLVRHNNSFTRTVVDKARAEIFT